MLFRGNEVNMYDVPVPDQIMFFHVCAGAAAYSEDAQRFPNTAPASDRFHMSAIRDAYRRYVAPHKKVIPLPSHTPATNSSV